MSTLADDTTPAPKAPSSVAIIAAVAVLTLIAAAGGWFLGTQLGLNVPAGQAAGTGEKTRPAGADVPSGNVVALKPILTNVKIPQDVWIRLEAGVVAKPGEKISDELAATVAGDFMAFLRTVNLMQLRGAAGLEYLRMDLQERARMRSEGKIEKVYIWALVME
ncbi:flagellar basal body-associated FliL family protein [Phyllobacterium myrsinacearum]|uniref:Flagellar protein FliL n=2 Tax=Phyllobacteriaceae TaxID=69277 RepID=A0A2S9JFF1_9HYPH|nr:flagellar basal body-associated FliL family protein [Phyllobacterium myrsinacearum]PRD51647.1 flagellar basal body protein FliL [Phyllobacterium myrsinacearum]PWV89489.1 flagellar FliL protein [Phyllobacterium myrsinacearum]RZS79242.1 flagellar FliL protein [Phyllobacterium myrsinacearum]RZU99919.1 flagellar FliL protein [Phyllobacterium myrsinacearum]